ncbi:MAG: Mu transposase C-terminal domain-containing protein [Chryseotalea sp.]
MKEIQIEPGLKVLVSGNKYQVLKRLSITSVIVKDEFDNEKIVSIKDITPLKNQKPDRIYDALSAKNQKIAEERFDIIKPIIDAEIKDGSLIKEIAKKSNRHPATIYRWLNIYFEYQEMTALAPYFEKRGAPGKHKIEDQLELIIQECINKYYLNEERHRITYVYNEIKQLCRNISVKPPNINTVRNRIKFLDPYTVTSRRFGKKYADSKFSTSDSKYEQAQYPLHIVEIDHTQLDIELVDEKYRKAIGRPYITIAIDVYSRMIVGIFLSFDGPGYLNVGVCIANAILPKFDLLKEHGLDENYQWNIWGKMKILHMDNALEFRGHNLAKICKNYGIDLQYRKLKKPEDGGHIEKFMDTLSNKLQDLPGKTFNNIQKKNNYDSSSKATLTLKEFEKWLIMEVIGVYHNSLHSGINNTPIKKFEEGVNGIIEENIMGRGMPQLIENPEKVRIDFLPSKKRTIQSKGVTLFSIPYFSTDLNALYIPKNEHTGTNKKSVSYTIKYDPRNLKYVYLLNSKDQSYIELTTKDLTSPNISLWEYRAIFSELKERNVLNIDHDKIFRAHAEKKKLIEEALEKTKNQKRSDLKKHDRKFPKRPVLEKKQNIVEENKTENVKPSDIKPFDEFDYGTFE